MKTHMDPMPISQDEIRRLVTELPNLHQDQRDAVRNLLTRLEQSHDGKIPQRDLHLALLKLREAHAITDLDMKSIEAAVFE